MHQSGASACLVHALVAVLQLPKVQRLLDAALGVPCMEPRGVRERLAAVAAGRGSLSSGRPRHVSAGIGASSPWPPRGGGGRTPGAGDAVGEVGQPALAARGVVVGVPGLQGGGAGQGVGQGVQGRREGQVPGSMLMPRRAHPSF